MRARGALLSCAERERALLESGEVVSERGASGEPLSAEDMAKQKLAALTSMLDARAQLGAVEPDDEGDEYDF